MNEHNNVKNNLELINELLEKMSKELPKERPNCRQILDNRDKWGLDCIETNNFEWNYWSEEWDSLQIYINHFEFKTKGKSE